MAQQVNNNVSLRALALSIAKGYSAAKALQTVKRQPQSKNR